MEWYNYPLKIKERGSRAACSMQLAFAFLSRVAERSADGTVHAFGAGCDALRLARLPAAPMSLALVAKFRCQPEEKGEQHEVAVDLSSPDGKRAHLAVTRVMVGEGVDNAGRPLGATVVAALDAPFEAEGEHVFHVSLDGRQVVSLPITVLVNGTGQATSNAMQLRAKWMRELGMSEEEIAMLCDAEAYPASVEEEAAHLGALERMRPSKWSI